MSQYRTPSYDVQLNAFHAANVCDGLLRHERFTLGSGFEPIPLRPNFREQRRRRAVNRGATRLIEYSLRNSNDAVKLPYTLPDLQDANTREVDTATRKLDALSIKQSCRYDKNTKFAQLAGYSVRSVVSKYRPVELLERRFIEVPDSEHVYGVRMQALHGGDASKNKLVNWLFTVERGIISCQIDDARNNWQGSPQQNNPDTWDLLNMYVNELPQPV